MRALNTILPVLPRVLTFAFRPSGWPSLAGWSLLTALIGSVRLLFGGNLSSIGISSAAAVVISGSFAFLLLRSFNLGDRELLEGTLSNAEYERLQAIAQLWATFLLFPLVVVLGLADIIIWWFLLGPPLLLLLLASSAVVLSDAQWTLFVAAPMLLGPLVLLLLALMHIADPYVGMDLQRLAWPVPVIAVMIEIALYGKLRRERAKGGAD